MKFLTSHLATIVAGTLVVAPLVCSGSSIDDITNILAIDAKGVVHHASDYKQQTPPWIRDLVSTVRPKYDWDDRISHRQGRGLFRLTLNVNTGVVKDVTMLKSSGDPTLNRSSIAALRQWRWKPNRWKQVDIEVAFRLQPQTHIPPDAVRLPGPVPP